jgi:hypothetical protein
MTRLGYALAVAIGIGSTSLTGASALAADTTFFAVLKGGNVVSSGGVANFGDPNGYGAASVVFRSSGTLCYSILVAAIASPVTANIHSGAAGVNGPVIVALSAPVAGNAGAQSACVTINSTVGNAIRAAPSNHYVVVRDTNFPSGSLRGQLF